MNGIPTIFGIRQICALSVFLLFGCAEPTPATCYDDPYHPLYRMNRVGWIPDRSRRPTPDGKPGDPNSRHGPPHPVVYPPPKEVADEKDDDDFFDDDDPPKKKHKKKKRKPKKKPPPKNPDHGRKPPKKH